jgi:hypothetical protein
MLKTILVSIVVAASWRPSFAQGVAAQAGAIGVAPVLTVPLRVAPLGQSMTPSFSGLGAPTLLPNLTPALPSVSALVSPTALPSGSRVAAVAPQAAVLPAPPGLKPVVNRQSKQQEENAAARPLLNKENKDAASPKALEAMGMEPAHAQSGRMFDGLGQLSVREFADMLAFRPPSWSEDKRINGALKRLADSPIGLDIYKYVYENHKDLRILVDDDRKASYDARLAREKGKPVLYLTQSLLERQSPEVVASYMAREMSDLYFDAFPVSAERGYLAYSNMARTYAELTGSGLGRRGYWWDTARDQWTGEAYAMQRYYGSWKEAVENAYRYGYDVRDSAFFRFLKGRDDSNTDPQAKLSLRELYYKGRISYQQYQEMGRYFDTFVGSEKSWMTDSGRW